MGALYCLDFPNGKKYIGITSGTVVKRFVEHVKASKRSGFALSRALRKHGADNVVARTLAVADDWAYLQLIERNAIRVFGTFGEGGYNMTAGGDGTPGITPTPESNAKRRATQLGAPKPVGHGDKIRRAFESRPDSIARIVAATKNREVSDATRKKISAAHKGLKRSAEVRERFSAAQKSSVANKLHLAKLAEAKRGVAVTDDQKAKKRKAMLQRQAGVNFYPPSNKWRARVFLEGKERALGYFTTEAEALAARKAAVDSYLKGMQP